MSSETLREILRELLRNAAQATQERGNVSVDALASGDYVDIRVEDDGPGIPAGSAERLFDPWVQNQMRVLSERRYYSKQDLDTIAKQRDCFTLRIFTLARRELANCLLMGDNPAVLLQLMGL